MSFGKGIISWGPWLIVLWEESSLGARSEGVIPVVVTIEVEARMVLAP